MMFVFSVLLTARVNANDNCGSERILAQSLRELVKWGKNACKGC
jgi:hypothetical protein